MRRIFKLDNLVKLVFVLFLIWIPFGTKKFIYAFVPAAVSELTSVFLYGSDLLLILFLILFWWRWIVGSRDQIFQNKINPVRLDLIFLLAMAAISVFWAGNKGLGFYQFFHLALGVLLAGTLIYLLKNGFLRTKTIMTFLALGGLFQALVAFWQFKFQHSLGFKFLGESLAGPLVKEASKISIAGATLIRTYGTMPHPNILAAFLVLGLLAFYYFYFRSLNRLARIATALSIFFIGLALIFTFSRSGWLTAVFGTFVFVVWGLLNKKYRRQAASLTVILVTCSVLFTLIMGWVIFPRARLTIDSSINDRLIYDKMAAQIISQHPLGVGIGNEMFFGIETKLFQKYGLETANRWQPIHNLYLLMASEIGLPGLLGFLMLLVLAVRPIIKTESLENGVALAMLFVLLASGFSDHFLWDLESGRLMLWLTIGVVLGLGFVNNNKASEPS